ncbi:histidine kinase [Streptomyces sp. NPDC049837]|uniref:sensor histidine kinase n=1 Tax=Streptomyces sp. NPDC049837 TaxID=3155277 RepID=UPI003437F0BE
MLFDLGIALGCALVPAMTLEASAEPSTLAWLAVYLVLCLATVVRRRWPAVLGAAVVVGAPVHLLMPTLLTYLLPGVCLYAVARYGRSRLVLALLSVAIVVRLAAARAVLFESDAVSGMLWHIPGEALFLAAPVVLGLYTRARVMVLENLRDKAERLEREQHLMAWRARMEERTRIAREMHDVVAHRVSLMVIHAGAIEVTEGVPEQATRSARLVGEIGRQAVEELREVLAVLRPDKEQAEEAAPRSPQPTLDDLSVLVEQSRTAGMNVDVTFSGARRPLDPGCERTAYRLVQEALTNIHKHAGEGATARVHVRYEPDTLHVAVENDAPTGPAYAPLPSGGHGLTGLRERVTVLGGVFDAGPRADGGFRVSAALPTKETTP